VRWDVFFFSLAHLPRSKLAGWRLGSRLCYYALSHSAIHLSHESAGE
jgi:hypothetical protein